ncbi:GroES-like protein [Melanomma pulvis-pyrius CBS 109.77]|uniref:GroES-like protein n=1 Tax=Melanomma pulvis-pyrius CBS 109.77 TaxID=1314802 RepID=A0A6A6XNG5_9PLEO|nr:GroES-like protein [Melanomma pulvis-pyrius CBS 109.77]
MPLNSLPKTYRAWRRTTGDLPRTIELTVEHLPQEISPSEIIVKIHAVSLNFRDHAMLSGRYPLSSTNGAITASDCAAEVVAIGSNVKEFKIGDRVAPTLNVADPAGKSRNGDYSKILGTEVGVLAEYAVFEEEVLVHLPKHLSWEEASTITCAGVTAWNALNKLSNVTEDTSVLLQGTGGVSMFALLLCIAAGVTPIITSSSDTKLEAIKKLSPLVKGFNYRTHPNQAETVNRLTVGKGVDIVFNNTGVASIPADLESLKGANGTVSFVGFLDQQKANWDPNILRGMIYKSQRIQGIMAGTKFDFQDVNKFLEEKNVRLDPILDRTFNFDDSKAAYKYLEAGKHVGKVVIKVTS